MTRTSAKDQNFQCDRIKKQVLIFTLRQAVFSFFPHYLNSIEEQVLQTWYWFLFYHKVLTSSVLFLKTLILSSPNPPGFKRLWEPLN